MDQNNGLIVEDLERFQTYTPNELRGVIEGQIWTFAKTMPQWPHEYIVRSRMVSDLMFVRFVATIRIFGYDQMWMRFKRRYLDVGRHRYWTQGDWLTTTCIINRALNERSPIPWARNSVPFEAKINTRERAYPIGER